jgi:hypothetical protein
LQLKYHYIAKSYFIPPQRNDLLILSEPCSIKHFGTSYDEGIDPQYDIPCKWLWSLDQKGSIQMGLLSLPASLIVFF